MKEKYDVVIIGSGPAGVTAAIYAARANLKVAIVEKDVPGGQVNKTASIENYPGYTSIAGPDLAMEFFKQINELKIPFIGSEVVEIDPSKEDSILLKNGNRLSTKAIILAIGRKPKKMKTENYDRLEGKGISYCALCDANLFKNEDVAVVGAGNSALEESLYLSNICSSVTILSRGSNLGGDRFLKEKIEAKDNIKVIYNSEVLEFNDYENDGILDSLTLKVEEKEEELKVKACFIFIGYEPATEFLQDLDILDEHGYIKTTDGIRTEIKGIYAAGDCVRKNAFQIVTATADGANAAIACTKDLKELE